MSGLSHVFRIRNRPGIVAAWVGGVLTTIVLLLAIAGPTLSRYRKDSADSMAGARPSWNHWLGTDALGKDVFTRVCYGGRLSLMCGGLSISLAVLIGAPLGAIAGYFGGAIDALVMRSVDVALTFPSVLIALLVSVSLPPGWLRVIIAVGLMNLPGVIRQCRATVLTVRNLDYVHASRALGATRWRTLRREILPSLTTPVIALATLGIGTAILEVAALSFLGIGGDPTEPEWGSMLAQSKTFWSKNPWAAAGPGLAITLTVLGFQLLGDALADALSPQESGRR